jgi:hypothetical protein
MAKKALVELTPREQALKNAIQFANVKAQISLLEKELEALKQSLGEYVSDTGEIDLGAVTVSEAQGQPKIVGASGKKLDLLIGQIIAEFPALCEQKLNVGLLQIESTNNVNLRNSLLAKGLEIVSTRDIRFKVVK